jgi:RNA polymerase sigma factor (sigma-70 family)
VTEAEADGASTDAASFCAEVYPRLVGSLSLYVGDRYLAEELAQEALLRACRQWPAVSRMDSPGGWTWRVAVNLANSHFRRRRAAARASRRLAAGEDVGRHDPDAAAAVAVRQAVAALPERQRTAVVLRYAQQLSVEETAVFMGVSSDAVRSLTKRAAASLRGELGEDVDPVVKEARDA